MKGKSAMANMTPQLKAQDCVDHDPIETWQPADVADVDYWLTLHIGPAGGRGADLFYVNVLSEAAAHRLSADELAQRKRIIVAEYSWSAVTRAIEDILDESEGLDWDDVAGKLAKKFDWEFENYQEYQAAAPNRRLRGRISR